MNSQTGKTIPRALSARVLAVLLAAVFMIPLCLPVSLAATNPYPDWQTNSNGDRVRPCTWYCWQQAYERLGIELYGRLGNGGQWLNNAIIQGYPTGNEAQPDSIAVYSGGTWGHVAYVTAVNGGTMTVIEEGRGLRYYRALGHAYSARLHLPASADPHLAARIRGGRHVLCDQRRKLPLPGRRRLV